MAQTHAFPAVKISPRRVFLQYLNPEILSLYRRRAHFSSSEFYSHSLRLTRYAFLLSDDILIMPASYLFEVKFINRFLRHLHALRAAALLQIASATPDLRAYAEKKRKEYREELELFPDYARIQSVGHVEDGLHVWLPRTERSSSRDIATAWAGELSDEGVWRSIMERHTGHFNPLSKWEQLVATVPDRLDDRAFIVRNAKALLPFELELEEYARVGRLISRAYLESYLDELSAMIMVDTPLGQLDVGLPQCRRDGTLLTFPYRALDDFFLSFGIRSLVEQSLGWRQLVELRAHPVFRWVMNAVVLDRVNPTRPLETALLRARFRPSGAVGRLSGTRAVGEILDRCWSLHDKVASFMDSADQVLDLSGPSIVSGTVDADASRSGRPTTILSLDLQPGGDVNKNDVFLVHGRDVQARDGLRSLLRAAGITPIDWEEAVRWTGKASPVTLDVVNTALARAQAAVILFTPDEHSKLREELLNPSDSHEERSGGYQPRPNVLVEAGMAFALYPDRTLILQVGSARTISDLAGLNYLAFDGSAPARRALLSRLQAAGCEPRDSEDFYRLPFEYRRT